MGTIMNSSSRRRRKQDRSGNILILSVLLLIPMLACVALAIDIGYLCLASTQLQAAADASALAAAGAMYEAPTDLEVTTYYMPPDPADTRQVAQQYVKWNGAAGYKGTFKYGDSGQFLQVDSNVANAAGGDIVIGSLNNPINLAEQVTPTTDAPNSVEVRIPLRNGHANGAIAMFFGRALGFNLGEMDAVAVATVDYPSLLPFGTSDPKWNSLASGGDGDTYSYGAGGVSQQPDGIPEIQIFPDNNWNEDGNLPPGNFGALELGGLSGTEILRRQIDKGPNSQEFAYHGSFEQGMVISGNTGVNGDVKTAFVGGNADERQYPGMLGKARYLPLYNHVEGNGTNSMFTITRFVAVRVVDVKMYGNPKWIRLQPVTEHNDLLNIRLTR